MTRPDLITRRQVGPPTSVDTAVRTFTAVIATEAAVEGVRLSLDGLHIPDTVPVQLDHETDVESTVGRVVRTWREGSELLAKIRLSEDPSLDWLLARLADGTVRGVSIGFRVSAWGPREGDVRVATSAELVEVSLTNFPADKAATVRSDIVDNQDVAVPTAEDIADQSEHQDRADRRLQVRDLRAVCSSLGLPGDFVDDLADDFSVGDIDRATADSRILQEVKRRSAVNIRIAHNDETLDNPDVRIRAMGEALYTRATPHHTPSAQASQFIGSTILDLARDCIRHRSITTTALSPMSTIERALHSTSDFPLLIGDSVDRTLRAAYAAAPSGLKLVGRRTTARDFRDKHRLQISEAPRLEKVGEGGEFTSGTLAEAAETYKVATYGRIIGVTRQLLVNDDLGAFTDLARRMGQAAMATEAALLVDLVEGAAGFGPMMSDGTALFDAAHGNLAIAESQDAPSVATLSAARQAMRAQVGLSGELIAVTPRYLIVPPALETDAEKVLATITPTNPQDHNPFSGTLALVVEPRLTDPHRWYIAAAPGEVDGLEYAYLEGQEGPQTDTRAGFDVDGVQVKVRLDFGAGFVDWRSWFMNEGTSS
ncbi:MAG: prohead protease/major capsid protein fusion protein [Pseudomonadota bacterium]